MLVVMVAVVMGLGLTACTKQVGKDDLAKEVKKELAAKVGQEPKSVTCDDNLKGEVGDKVRCTLTADDGTKYGVTVTATQVDGDHVKFDIQVDDTPKE